MNQFEQWYDTTFGPFQECDKKQRFQKFNTGPSDYQDDDVEATAITWFAAIRTVNDSLAAGTHKIVPINPTVEQLEAAATAEILSVFDMARPIYKAMVKIV